MEKLDKYIISRYKNGESLLNISKSYKCSRQTITRYIKKYNEFKERVKPIQSTKIDISQIENMTKEMSYFLGLLWTDGYLSSNNGYTIGIKILKDDMHEILSTIDNIGKYSYNDINSPNRRPATSVAFFSKEFYEFLIKMDYKSKSISSADKIISIIPENLRLYFYRGVIDGDGYIGIKNDNGYQLTITGHYDQDWKYIEDIFKKYNIKYSIEKKSKPNSSASRISIFNYKDILNFLNYIYTGYDSDRIGFKRKHRKYKDILNRRGL